MVLPSSAQGVTARTELPREGHTLRRAPGGTVAGAGVTLCVWKWLPGWWGMQSLTSRDVAGIEAVGCQLQRARCEGA